MKLVLKNMQICFFTALLVSAMLATFPMIANATQVGYPDLRVFDFNDLASSLKVTGTVTIYDDINYGGGSISFSNTNVHSLGDYGWNDRMSSLKIDGSVTLYEHNDYGGRAVTFVSTPDPNGKIGTYQWNTNPTLVKSQGACDSRVWGWDIEHLELVGPDSNNYVNWVQDGQVTSQCQDTQSRPRWGASNFDQGYSMDQRWIPDLTSSGQTDSGHFGYYVGSLKLQGRVTLYENANYGGASITLGPFTGTDGWIPDLTQPPYSWTKTTKSLHLYDGSTLTVWSYPNYAVGHQSGGLLTFAAPSYQPGLLRIGDASTITLEGLVKDWHTDDLAIGSCSWTGVKFDVWAVQDPARSFTGSKLMLELYFVRAGVNLWWGNAIAKPGLNKMVAIDCYPDSVQRTAYPGCIQGWKVDLLRFLTDCAGDYGIDIWSWYLAQISFTVESGSSPPYFETPKCYCSLNKMRVCYDRPPLGGCPYLNTWNGKHYVNEGLLDIHSSDGTDVFAFHNLITSPARVQGNYQFKLVEHPQTISQIDQVRLFAVLENNKVVELPLVYAMHSEYGNVLPQFASSDNWRTEELGAKWNGGVSQSIQLKFKALPQNVKVQKFVFIIEGNNIITKT